MKTSTCLVLLLFSACAAFADPASIIKQRAKDMRDQSNARQGVPPAQPSRSGTASAAPAGTPAPQTGQPQSSSLQKLVADIATIKSRSQVTPDLKQRLAADLMACASGATKPSQESINKLADDLTAAVSGKKISSADQTQLARDINALLNSASISPAEAQSAGRSASDILEISGATKQDAQLVIADLQAIGAELKKTAKK
jgi:hypothetical protein